MNYIHKLQRKVASLEAQVDSLEDGLADLRAYALSDKFLGEGNDFMNPQDVVLRVDNIVDVGSIALAEAGEEFNRNIENKRKDRTV